MGLLDLVQNRAVTDRLAKSLNGAGVIPFVGAGLSAPYQLPQWGELLQKMTATANDRAEVDRLVGNNDYEGAAQFLLQSAGPDRFQIVLRETLNVPIDTRKRTALAKLLELPRGPIITTNFDRVLESVFEAATVHLNVVIGNRKDAIRDAFSYREDTLIKIHGDLGDAAERVLVPEEYDNAYSTWLENVFRNLATVPILFLGYSLKNDRPVQVLERLKKEGKTSAVS